jgi:hypothetical protein
MTIDLEAKWQLTFTRMQFPGFTLASLEIVFQNIPPPPALTAPQSPSQNKPRTLNPAIWHSS